MRRRPTSGGGARRQRSSSARRQRKRRARRVRTTIAHGRTPSDGSASPPAAAAADAGAILTMASILTPGPNPKLDIFLEKKAQVATGKVPEEPRKKPVESDCLVHYPKDVKGMVLL